MKQRISLAQARVLDLVRHARRLDLGRLYTKIDGRSTRRTVTLLLRREAVTFADGRPGRLILTVSGRALLKSAPETTRYCARLLNGTLPKSQKRLS